MGAGFLLWLAFGPQNQNVNHPSERHDLSHVENVVNKHLILTNKKIELAQEAARLKNVQTIPAVGEQILPRWKPSEVVGVDQSYDRNELNAARDLARHPELSLNSPGAIVQSEMADSEVTTQLESEQREEYARQFIQNARAGGYDVELDENYRVKKVRKIRPVGPTQAQGGAAR